MRREIQDSATRTGRYYVIRPETCREMAFECRQCGRCCMYMGDYIVIECQLGPYEFACRSVSTGTPFSARIESDKRHLFADRSWIGKHPSACHFLRPSGERIVCTIHGTSPAQCRAYRCIIARIRSPGGDDAGYMTGTLALHTSDPSLRDAWGEVESAISVSPDDAEEQIARILGKRGYWCTAPHPSH